MNKEVSLKKLNTFWKKKCVCALKKTATQAVPGDGNPDTDILFIGEAPGKKEDERGVSFVGAAGKFLTEMLASINLKREDVYITNIVKYRPPENRDPLPQEILDCEEWLHQQIKIIQPKIIVTLGRYALEHFLPGKKISEAHGKIFKKTFPDLGEQTFYILYHPAAALYNGSLRAILLKDFQGIVGAIKKSTKNPSSC